MFWIIIHFKFVLYRKLTKGSNEASKISASLMTVKFSVNITVDPQLSVIQPPLYFLTFKKHLDN